MKKFLLTISIFLFSLFILPSTGTAKKTIPAADHVKDGQKIDLEQEKYQALFYELEQELHFSKVELNAIFKGVSIKRKVLVLMDTQWEAKPYYKYRPLTIVELEIDPKKGGGIRYIAGYPNFQAIAEWNHSNRYAMAVSEFTEAIR